MSHFTRGFVVAQEILDDATARYAADAHQCFSGLQNATGRLAGLLILLAFKNNKSVVDTATLDSVKASLAYISDRLRGLEPTYRSMHFHFHLGNAQRHVESSAQELQNFKDGMSGARDPLPELQQAWLELTSASRALPGFEIVDFRQSCCSMHFTR